jgi:XRE family aerobic/anaerobic benzoate catabolism transcriptional regulator
MCTAAPDPSAQVQLLHEVGLRVRRLRGERELTLRGLAQRAGLSPRFVSQLEAGKGNIAIGRLAGVARALEVPLTELVAAPSQPHGPRGRIEQLLSGRSDAELTRCAGAIALVLGERRRNGIALLGLRGAGKSTLGSQLAAALGLAFVELDERIEAAAGLSLTEVFTLHGEAYYRRLERQCLADLLGETQPFVVALGGGVVHNEEAFQLARDHLTTVWLQAQPEDHMSRVLAQGDRRPVDQSQSADAMAELRALLTSREPFYGQAEITLDTSHHGAQTLPALLDAMAQSGWDDPRS